MQTSFGTAPFPVPAAGTASATINAESPTLLAQRLEKFRIKRQQQLQQSIDECLSSNPASSSQVYDSYKTTFAAEHLVPPTTPSPPPALGLGIQSDQASLFATAPGYLSAEQTLKLNRNSGNKRDTTPGSLRGQRQELNYANLNVNPSLTSKSTFRQQLPHISSQNSVHTEFPNNRDDEEASDFQHQPLLTEVSNRQQDNSSDKVKRVGVRHRILKSSTKSSSSPSASRAHVEDKNGQKVQQQTKLDAKRSWWTSYLSFNSSSPAAPNNKNAQLAINESIKSKTLNIPKANSDHHHHHQRPEQTDNFIMGMLRTMKLKERLAISLGATLILLTLLLVVDVQMDFGVTNRHLLPAQQTVHQRIRYTDDGSFMRDIKRKFLQKR